MNLAMYNPLIQAWYQWGHFVALAVAAAAAFWVFYDAARRGVRATVWKVFTGSGVILVFPSFLLWALPTLSTGNLATTVVPLAYVGLGAAVLALLSLFLYLAGVGVGTGETYCPVCGQPLLPSWEYCPYCAQREAQQAAAALVKPPPPPPPSSPPPVPIEPVAPRPFESPPPRLEKTEVLRAVRLKELAWLVLLSGAHAGKEFRLGEVTTIGRDPARNDVVVEGGAVSRQHAKVRLQEGQFVLYDLASTDGTLVKDRETDEWVEVQKHTLADGDQVKMGQTIFSFMQIAEEQA